MKRSLFDNDDKTTHMKEETPLNKLKNLDEKIADAVSKVKALKDENLLLSKKVKELEVLLEERDQKIEILSREKTAIKGQIEDLLGELELIESK